MFRKWLLVICTLLFVSNQGNSARTTTCGPADDVYEVNRIVQADNQYGWQVSRSSVSAYDVPAN
jgi:hypothetical protein